MNIILSVMTIVFVRKLMIANVNAIHKPTHYIYVVMLLFFFVCCDDAGETTKKEYECAGMKMENAKHTNTYTETITRE